jgi:protein SCO1
MLSGCKSNSRSTAFSARNPGGEHHMLHGKVISVDTAHKQVTIAHGEIKDYMPAMTMGYPVENASELAGVQPGDEVDADLVVENNTGYLQAIDVTKPVNGQRPPAKTPGAATHYPQVGESAHDFQLTTENGRTITLADFKGKPLLVDFIYSQCPQPQFCPLLNIKFAEVAHKLQADKSPAQLLSVSIDPEHDTVPVLKQFSTHFDAITRPANNDANWNFATGTPQQVRDFAGNMGLDYWPESGQIVHSVVVYLIDGNGKIAKIWTGNDWKSQDAVDAIKSLKS